MTVNVSAFSTLLTWIIENIEGNWNFESRNEKRTEYTKTTKWPDPMIVVNHSIFTWVVDDIKISRDSVLGCSIDKWEIVGPDWSCTFDGASNYWLPKVNSGEVGLYDSKKVTGTLNSATNLKVLNEENFLDHMMLFSLKTTSSRFIN